MLNLIREILLIDVLGQLLQGILRLAVIVVLGLIILWLLGGQCFGGFCFPDIVDLPNVLDVFRAQQEPAGEPQCPRFPDAFPQLLPDTWAYRFVQSINIDGDDANECLVLYEYDAGGGPYGGGPIGGVVYDPQPDIDAQLLERGIPWRPATWVPYHLYPRENGQGFLSERQGGSDWSSMIETFDADGRPGLELVVHGYSGYSFPTYLSVFRWEGPTVGYRPLIDSPPEAVFGGTLYGEAGVDIGRETHTDDQGNVVQGQIERVVVMERPTEPFWYFRSLLCYAHVYGWDWQSGLLAYQNDYYLTYCFDRPNGLQTGQSRYFVWYPEQAIVAYYPEGGIKEIRLLPPYSVDNRQGAIVTLRQDSLQKWEAQAEWRQEWDTFEASTEKVADMTYWQIQQVGLPYDP
jgi:hypothetical protein